MSFSKDLHSGPIARNQYPLKDNRMLVVGLVLLGFCSSNFLTSYLAFDGNVDNTVKTKFELYETSEKGLIVTSDSLNKHLIRAISAENSAFFYLPVPVNKASAAVLQTVKGVGPELARRIVEHRENHGKISDKTDLEEIKGIGIKKAHYLSEKFSF